MSLKYQMIFLDRDGTLNPDPGYISSLKQYEFYPFTLSALRLLYDTGARFCIVSNQSGVSRGLIDPQNLKEIHDWIRQQFLNHGMQLDGIYICTDHPDKATQRRKPGTGMFEEAAGDLNLKLERCLMIGDSISDIDAGRKLGMETMLVLTGEGEPTLNELESGSLDEQPTYVVRDLAEGVQTLLEGIDQ